AEKIDPQIAGRFEAVSHSCHPYVALFSRVPTISAPSTFRFGHFFCWMKALRSARGTQSQQDLAIVPAQTAAAGLKLTRRLLPCREPKRRTLRSRHISDIRGS